METKIIKPCPFCGGKKIRVYKNESDKYVISCEKCGDFYMNTLFPSEKTVIEAWNNRKLTK